ncbi:MAG: amidase [Acidobacteria bacterium]|nr:amidase [Acidobacteriota bacterium]MCA1639598.1 amidase [Acidobacteriota bacterium]
MKIKKQSRREFLKSSVIGVVAIGVLKDTMASEITVPEPDIELIEVTVSELQAGMKSGKFTAKALVEKYLERIREIDPKLRSVIETNPDAIKIAEQMDKERKRGKVRSRLHGIPVLIKDNIDTADRMKTTAGSFALIEAPTPERDAFIVRQLRKSGAVIIGKTNLSEWANFRSTKSISGWSGRGGQTNNPYILDKNPCGSSSGSGVAISANLAAVAVGTETNGSIICPATQSGVVGIKPTLGLVSRSGIIPIAHTQDTAGPMTRTVADAAILLGVLVGEDKRDATTTDSKKGEKDYTKFLDVDGLRGARIGVARQFVGNNAKQKEIFESHLEALNSGGATLIDVTFAEDFGKLGDERLQILLYEFKTNLNKYLAERRSPYKTLADLIKFNEQNKEREMPLFGQELFLQSQSKGDLTEKAYTDAIQKVKRASREEGIDAVVAKDKIDCIVSPAVGRTWSIAAVAGYPYITVPAGLNDGLPVGIAFFGRAFTEPQLIKIAFAFEQKTKLRQTPKFLPKAA